MLFCFACKGYLKMLSSEMTLVVWWLHSHGALPSQHPLAVWSAGFLLPSIWAGRDSD